METLGDRYLTLANEIGCSAIIFNQRGIQPSQGQITLEGYVLDAYSMFEYLIDKKGIQANDIAFYGTSLGGGSASEAAAMVQKKYPWAKINLINERSFSSFRDEVLVLSKLWVPVLGKPLAKGVLWATNLYSFDAKTSAESLRGRVCVVYHKDDGTVPYAASLNKAIALFNCQAQEIIRIELLNDDPAIQDPNNHTRPFTWVENEAVKLAIKRVLNIPELGFQGPQVIKDRVFLESRLA